MSDSEAPENAVSSQPPPPSPAEVLADKISSLQSQLNNMRSSVLMASLKDEIDDVNTTVNNLPTLIGRIRTAGHVFDGDLEKKSDEMRANWPQVRDNALGQINSNQYSLQNALQNAESELQNLINYQSNPDYALTIVSRSEGAIQSLQSQVSAVNSAVRGSYDSFINEAKKIEQRVGKIQEMMDLVTAATFQLLIAEGVIAVVPGKLDKEGKDDPKGYVFLTDQRILFEQNEEVATKKVLFIATEKQKVQKLLVDMPLSQLEKVTASKKGMMGNEDHLDLMFESGAAVRTAHFHINGQDCNAWQTMINRAKTKDYDKERAVKVDTGVTEKMSTAPTKCSSCGANFTKPVMRGQTEMKCEYCGAMTRW